MEQQFEARHESDEQGNPAGGKSIVKNANGDVLLEVNWQNGPLGNGVDRIEPNGAFVETLIAITKDRIEYYQKAAGGKFYCAENATAINKLQQAGQVLQGRTNRRQVAGVEGTHGQANGDGPTKTPEHIVNEVLDVKVQAIDKVVSVADVVSITKQPAALVESLLEQRGYVKKEKPGLPWNGDHFWPAETSTVPTDEAETEKADDEKAEDAESTEQSTQEQAKSDADAAQQSEDVAEETKDGQEATA